MSGDRNDTHCVSEEAETSSMSAGILDGVCPLPECGQRCRQWKYLSQHWASKHQFEHGMLSDFLQQMSQCEPTRAPINDASSCDEEEVDCTSGGQEDVLSVAMKHIDEMKYRYFETDAQTQRAKMMAQELIQECISPAVTQVISQYLEHAQCECLLYSQP